MKINKMHVEAIAAKCRETKTTLMVARVFAFYY